MSNRKIDRLSHLKSDTSQIKKGFPSKEEGVEGNIELRHIPGYGLAIFAFSAGNWHVSKMELQKVSKSNKKLVVDEVKVKKVLDLDNNEIRNLNPDKVRGAEKWNDAHKNLTSGKYKAKFESVQLGDARVSIDKDNVISFSNVNDGNDVEIKTRRVRFDKTESESSPSIDVAEGDLHYDSSTKAVYASSGGLWANAASNFNSGQTSQLLLMAKHADSIVKFADNVNVKWVAGYDKHGATTFTDATCDTTSGNTTITFDGSGTADSSAVVGMLVSGTGIPTGSVVSTKSSGSMTISEPATATNTNTTLTFAENDGRFKINTGANLADPSLFELDTSGNLEIAGTLDIKGASANLGANSYMTLAENEIDVSSGNLLLDVAGQITLDSFGKIINLDANGTTLMQFDLNNTIFKIMHSSDTGDYFQINVNSQGATTISTLDDSASNAHLTINADGHVEFDDCAVGFDKFVATFSTSNIIGDGNDSTDIDFRRGNKYELELTNNISGSSEFINLIFPATSGNFLLVLSQDNTGTRTVASTGWVVYQSDGATKAVNAAFANGTDGEVRWAGGSAPTLTTTADKADIISFYWDADNETCFATISQNF
tara:strand:- start:4548 stop:6347 length:1800 start_codon:yes stop_codon:yes gene_type:complete